MFHVRFYGGWAPFVRTGRGLLVIYALGFVLAMLSCRRSEPLPTTTVAIVTGRPGGVFEIVGSALAAAYSRRLTGIHATTHLNPDLESTLDVLEHGDVDLAFDDSETAYRAYRKGTTGVDRPHTRIRAIANLFPTVVHIVARRDLSNRGTPWTEKPFVDTVARHRGWGARAPDTDVMAVTAFRGTRVNVGPADRPTAQVARLIFESYGLTYDSMHAVFDEPTAPATEIRTGKIDGIILWVPFHHPLMVSLTSAADVRLVPLERKQIESIQERTHFLKSTIIPKGTYRGQSRDVPAIAEDILLLCRSDLSEALVYDLTRALFDLAPELVRAHPAARSIDPERGPTTSIPLHPGAARYYRERELPR